MSYSGRTVDDDDDDVNEHEAIDFYFCPRTK